MANVVGMYMCIPPTLWGIFTLWGRHCGDLFKKPHSAGYNLKNSPQWRNYDRKKRSPHRLVQNLDVESNVVGNKVFQIITKPFTTFMKNCFVGNYVR